MLANRGLLERRDEDIRARGLAVDVREVGARPESPSRWTLPITALRVTPPMRLAIWLALSPSDHSFFKVSTRSSFHDILVAPWESQQNARAVGASSASIGATDATCNHRPFEGPTGTSQRN